MAIKRFSSADWLTSHGYELPQSPSTTGAYSYSSSKPVANKTLDIDRFSSADWLKENGYDIPKPYEYKAPTIDYALESQLIEQEKKSLSTGMGFSMPDITDGLGVGEGISATGQYIGGKAISGVGSLLGAIFEMPDMTTKALNNMMGNVVNPIRKAMGLEALDYNISLREWQQNVGKEIQKKLGIKNTQIDTTKIKNEGLAQFIDDYQTGKNQLAEMYYRTAENFSKAVEPIKQEVDKVKTGWGKVNSTVMKYGGMVAESAPQSAIYAIPVAGAVFGTGAAYSRSLRESYAREDLTAQQATNLGMTSGAIDAYSELIFGLFGEGAALVKGATAKAIAKGASGAVGKATVGKVIGSVFLSGAEEGLEEMIAYPAQQYVQWRYSNGGKPVEEYSAFFNAQDFGDAGITGFISGFLFAGGQAIHSSRLDAKQQKKVQDIDKKGVEISQMPIDDITKPENMSKVADFVNAVSDAVINDPEIFSEQSPLKTPVAEDVILQTPATKQDVVQESVVDKEQIRSRRKEIREIIKTKFNKETLTQKEADEYKAITNEYHSLGFDLGFKIKESVVKSKEDRKSILDFEDITTIHNDEMKNKEAYMSINEASSGVFINADTPIDNIMNGKNKNISASEFYNLFQDTRNILRKKYGDTIKLYRAKTKQKSKYTKNYATTRENAEQYGQNIEEVDVPIENIIAVHVGSGNYHEVIVGKPPVQAKQETKTEPKPKSTITFKSIMDSNRSETEYKQAIDEWLDSKEGKSWLSKMDTPEKVNKQVVALRQSLVAIRAMPLEQQEKAMLKVNLQLLALKSFADRSMNTPEGKRLRSVLGNLVPRLAMNKSQQDITTIENMITDEEMFYLALSDEEARTKGLEIASKSNADDYIRGKLESGEELKREDVVAMGMRIQQKLDNIDDEMGIEEAHMWLNKLSIEATKSGQFIEAFRVLYQQFPEYKTKSMVKKLKKVTGHDIVIDDQLEKKTKQTADIINNIKQTTFEEVASGAETRFKEASKDVEPKKERLPQDKLTPQEQLAKRIEQSQVERKINTNEVTRMVNELYRKYLEVAVVPDAPKKIDPFVFLAEVALNKNKYAYVYNEAKNIIKATFADNENMIGFFNQVTDPTFSEVTMNRAIGIMLKEHNMSLASAAKQVVLTDWNDIQKYEDWLNNKFSFLDEASRSYLMEYMMERFNVAIASKRSEMYDAYEKRVAKGRTNKEIREVTIEALKDVTFYNALKIDSVNALWARRLGVPYISDDMRNTIYKYMKQITKQQSLDTQEANQKIEELYNQMYYEIFKDVPASWQDKIKAIRRFGMLGNFRTPIRNGVTNWTNGLMMNMSDRLQKHMEVSKFFGVDAESQVFGGSFYQRGSDAFIDNAVNTSSSPSRIKVLLEQTSGMTVASHKGVAQQLFKNKFIDKLLKAPYELSQNGTLGGKNLKFLGDSFMFERHFKFAMENKLKMLKYNTNMTIEQKKSAIEAAEKQALSVAVVRTFREHNRLSDSISSLANQPKLQKQIEILYEQADKLKRDGKTTEYNDTIYKIKTMKNKVKAISTAVDFVAPFVVTPAALIKESYKYSPLSLAVSSAQFLNAKHKGTFKGQTASDINAKIAQSIVGTAGLSVLGLVLRSLGILDLEEPKDKKQKLLWQQEGRTPFSVYVKGVGSFTIDWAQPLMSSVMLGGYVWDIINNDASMGERVLDTMITAGDSIINKSLLDNILRQFGGYGNSTTTERIAQIGANGIMQSLPIALQQLNRVMDNYVRNAYDGNALEIMANRVLMTIPFGTKAIDTKYDIWGRPVEQTKYTGIAGGAIRFTMNMVSPFTYSEDRMDTTTKEVVRLYKALEGNAKLASGVLPTLNGNSITVTTSGIKRNWTFAPDEAFEYQKLSSTYQKQEVDAIISKAEYAKYTDEVKAKLISDAYGRGIVKAQREMMKKYPPTSISR